MKKIKYLFLLCVLTFLLTGCVKFNANMDISKDKSMNFSIIYAFDTSIFGDQQLLEDKDKQELEKQGFTITDYSQDNMKGFNVSKKIKNIDTVSSETDTEYTLSGILDNNSEENYIFKVKKGLLKNTYIAKFKFDASDSDLSNSTDDSSSNSDWSFDTDDSDNSSSFDFGDGSSDMDISSMMSNIDLSFNVTLPYSAKSNNATTTNNDNKDLSWNLSSTQAEAIEFEFELYNMTTVYIGFAGIVILVLIIIITISNKKNNSGKGVSQSTETIQPMQQPTMINNESSAQTNQSIEQQNIQVQQLANLQPTMDNNQDTTQVNHNIEQQNNSIQQLTNLQPTMDNNQNTLQTNQNVGQQVDPIQQLNNLQPTVDNAQQTQPNNDIFDNKIM